MNKTKFLNYFIAVFVIIMSLSSCNENHHSNKESIFNSSTISENSQTNTSSDIKYEETGQYLFKNNKSDYSIVIAEKALKKEIQAKDELVDFFKRSTGHTLKVINDRNVTYDKNAKYISIGDTKLLKESGISVSREELKKDGFKIKTDGNLIIIAGPSELATLYGTYRFMNYIFGFRTYSIDEVYYEKKDEIPLVDFNETNIPDFEERQLGYWGMQRDEISRDRMAYTIHGNNWIYGTHSHFKIMPKDEYWDNHRDYYSKDGTQLCLTNEEMKKEFIKNLKVAIQANPEDEYILLGEEDAHTFCECDRCLAATKKYGTVSGVDMVFVNSVAKEIEEWLKVEEPTRVLKIGTFAYLKTLEPPATYNENTNTWVPNHKDVIARDNVFIFLAPLYANFSYPFLHEKNSETKNAFEGWSSITKQFCVWTYSANAYSYFTNFMNFSTQAKQYQELRDLNTSSIIDLGPYDSNTPTFHQLRMYLCSRLMWDADLNTEALIDDFFKHYYKDAYHIMKKYFDSTRSYMEYLMDKHELDTLCYVIYNKLEYWPQAYLNSAMALLNEAINSISHLKDENPALYETLLNRINLESLSPRYYMLRYYQTTYTTTKQAALIDEFEEICKLNDVTQWAEKTNLAQGDNTIETLISGWRKSIR